MDYGLRGATPASIFARPTADELWLGPAQSSALSRLSGDAAIAGICGGPASGKSLLLERCRLDLLPAEALALSLDGNAASARSALARLLAGTGLNASHLGPVDQRNLLQLVVTERLRKGLRVLVFVDDVDRLPADVIDELDRLRRFGIGSTQVPQLRFAFDPSRLDPRSAELLDLRRRCLSLPALSEAEVRAYVQWRMERCGLTSPFTATALALVRRHTHGIFRGIDSLCRLSLLLMHKDRSQRVDVHTVNAAVRLLNRQRTVRCNVPRSVEALRPADTVSLPAGRFIVTEHGAPVMQVALARRLLVGRSPSNEIAISGVAVSRYHAMIEAVDDRVEIVDLNSANGVLVNGERCRQAVLKNNDVVTIGAFRLKLEQPRAVGERRARTVGMPDTVVLAPSARSPRSHLKGI